MTGPTRPRPAPRRPGGVRLHRALLAALALAIVVGHSLQIVHFATHVHFLDEFGVVHCAALHESAQRRNAGHEHGTTGADEGAPVAPDPEEDDGDECPFVPPGLVTTPALPDPVRVTTPPATGDAWWIRPHDGERPVEILRLAPKQSPPVV